jgi:Velvet factor
VRGERHSLGSASRCTRVELTPTDFLPVYPADRRPIDPPPIVQLRVIDKARKNLPSPSPSPPPPQHHQQPPHPHAHVHESSGPLDTSMLTPAGFGGGPFLQNPYYFMFASLAKPDDDTELHWMKVCYCAPHHFLPSSAAYSQSTVPFRTERRDVPRDQLSRRFITSRTRRMTTGTRVSSSFRILVCDRRGRTVSSLVFSKL